MFSKATPSTLCWLAGIFCVLTFGVPKPGLAQQAGGAPPIALDFPLKCQPGVDCWIANYVDLDPGPRAQDYTCGPRSYQGHKGTDIAIRDRSRMNIGVEVLAAAPGIVAGARNDMKDLGAAGLKSAEVKDRECGNGVRVRHAGGWFTQYCHMRRGSVVVNKGDKVSVGQVLGQVGLSGRTVFPHLHFGLSRDGRPVDPFRGLQTKTACGLGAKPYWKPAVLAKIGYQPAIIYNIGFATELPKPQAVRNGRYHELELSRHSPALILWVDMFGIRAGDRIEMRVAAPNGRTITKRTIKVDRTLARAYRATGRGRPGKAFPPGKYRGEATIHRDTPTGLKQFRAEAHVNLR